MANVTLTTFCLFGKPITPPLVDPMTIGESVTYIRSAMDAWDYFILETRDNSAAIVFVDRKTFAPQSTIF